MDSRAQELLRSPRVAEAIRWLRSHEAWITRQQIRLTQIPAPPFGEERRARAFRALLKQAGYRAELDETGNAIAEAPGETEKIVLLSAHLDTAIRPPEPVRVRREGTRLEAPGICDNGAGLAALLAVAVAFRAARIEPRLRVVFAANVGEEGEGNLRGMRALAARYGDRLDSVIAIDGASTTHIVTTGLASRRFEVVMRGPGGHSWADAGAPSAIHAMGRAIARILAISLPQKPRVTLNVGAMEGGEAVNAIAARASIKLDLRSESESALADLENEIRWACERAAADERENATGAAKSLSAEFRALGSRPAGRLAADSPLLAAVRDADRFMGFQAQCHAASTDANLPLSLQIPALALGAGGKGGRVHTNAEWYDAAGRVAGVERILLVVLLAAGLAG